MKFAVVMTALAVSCAAPSHAGAPATWFKAKTPHCIVYSRSDSVLVANLASEIEEVFQVAQSAGLVSANGAIAPLTVLGYRSGAELSQDLPAAAGRLQLTEAVFGRHLYGGSIGMQERGSEGLWLARVATLQSITASHARKAPIALRAGLASYFAAYARSREGFVVGLPIPKFRERLISWPLMSMDELFGLTAAEVGALSPSRQLHFEAESWALVHYLLARDSTGSSMTSFLDSLERGNSAREALESSFPGTQWDQLKQVLDRYVAGQSFSGHVLAGALNLKPSDLEVSVVSRVEVDCERALLRTAIGAATNETGAILARCRESGEQSHMATAVSGYFAWTNSDSLTARGLWGSVPDSGACDSRARFIAGAGTLLLEVNDEALRLEQVERALSLLEASLACDATHALIRGWCGVARLCANKLGPETVELLRSGCEADPEDKMFGSYLSLALAQIGESQAAREFVQSSKALSLDQDSKQVVLADIEQVALRERAGAAAAVGDYGTTRELLSKAAVSEQDPSARAELERLVAAADSGIVRDSVMAQLEAGDQALREGNGEAARVHFERGLALALDEEARTICRMAIASADTLIQMQQAEAEFELGRAAMEANSPAAAKSRFKRALELTVRPEARPMVQRALSFASAAVEYDRGLAALRRSAWQEAIRAFEAASRLSPEADLRERATTRARETKEIMSRSAQPAK
ncbi:MAG: hypothetical protein IT454_17985 [Planctomycetes bacterium]|nr:hypothetical protein [Planctomycetota bacterium]